VSVEAAALNHPYKCRLPDGTFVGGSYDDISAVTIAAAYYQVLQILVPEGTGQHSVIVYDDTDTPIAIVGKDPNPPTETIP